jgi:hypothetical protein
MMILVILYLIAAIKMMISLGFLVTEEVEVSVIAGPGLFLYTPSKVEGPEQGTVLYQLSLKLETILTGTLMAESVMMVLMLKFFLKRNSFLVPLL